MTRPALAAVFGCAGPTLTEAERRFFRAVDPLGFILFARNCIDPSQVKQLVRDLRSVVERHAPVLIDQEGGRVMRLTPPHWRAAPPAGHFGELATRNRSAAIEAAYLNARLLASDLSELGIDVDCAPVLDLRLPGAHEVIGDRALGNDPMAVADLGRAVARGLTEGRVLPVMKHIPGHGRALVDSHYDLPAVDADRRTLELTDFEPFRRLADLPWAMTAHVVYRAVDADRPATLSAKMIREVIRSAIGFAGFLISDDLAMKALKGDAGWLAATAIEAGCDAVLHCNGVMAEMERIAAATPRLRETSLARLARGAARLPAAGPALDRARAEERVATLLAA